MSFALHENIVIFPTSNIQIVLSRSEKDRIYANKKNEVNDFVFDEDVANVFEDMIKRSVPGYIALNQLLPVIANQFLQQNTHIYDLGCSLGEASISIAKSSIYKNIQIYSVDNSDAMVNQLQERIVNQDLEAMIKVILSDIANIDIKNASFVILNYTLQFIQRSKRNDLIKKIYTGLNPGGALLLSEKITYQDKEEDKLMQRLHENFKRLNDYSELEISQKRESLENVLIRDTHEQHVDRLRHSGFSEVSVLIKYLNFVTYLAIK